MNRDRDNTRDNFLRDLSPAGPQDAMVAAGFLLQLEKPILLKPGARHARGEDGKFIAMGGNKPVTQTEYSAQASSRYVLR
jgi:hypothetical protein